MTLTFTLKRKTIPVEIEQEDGTVLNYSIVELDGLQRDSFLTKTASRLEGSADKKIIRNFDGLQSSLLAMCLQDENGKSVPERIIQGWPARVSTALFQEAQKLNGMDEKAAEDLKNASQGSD